MILPSAAKHVLKKLGLIVFLLPTFIGLINSAQANTNDSKAVKKQVIYLVRHAEKLKIDKDPALTNCGLQRADALAKQLSAIKFTNIYSTNYQRTALTAKPLADQSNISISYYDPSKLKQFAQQVSKKQGISLIVGHSNTTAVLAGLLAQQTLSSFDESIYDRLYQVVIINGHASLQLLMQNFVCTSPNKI